MGNSESKLGFKQDVFALAGDTCPDPTQSWWTRFYTLPESADDVFTLFSQHDIRALTTNPSDLRSPKSNLETLIYLCVARLQKILNDADSIAENENVPREMLNCIRLLTRCLPHIYEVDVLQEWEDAFFWQARRAQQIQPQVFVDGLDPAKKLNGSGEEIGPPLGKVLLELLVRCLFTHGLTLPKKVDGRGMPQLKTSWSIWNSGIGCKKSAGMTKDNERNAAEILSLLLVLCSRQMYFSPMIVAESTVPALRYLTTESDRQIVLTLLCSLMNTVLKYNPSSWLVNPVGEDPRARLVQLSLQFLTLLVLYGNSGSRDRNEYRHQLGRVHKPEDLQFIHQGITTALQSMVPQGSGVASYVPGPLKPSTGSPESIVLLWEILKTNKRFRAFVIETDRVHDLVVMVLCCAMEAKDDMAKHGVLRLCILLLQTLSQDREFATRLNMPLVGAETLPARLKISNFHGSYADFLILSLRSIMLTSNGTLEAMYAPMLFIIDDIAPDVRNLQRATSIRLFSLFSALANADYLYRRRDNPQHLVILLDAFTRILEHNPQENPRFVEALLRTRKQVYALRDFTVNGAHAELDRQAQRQKDHPNNDTVNLARTASIDSVRSPTSIHSPSLSHVPENDAFAIGNDDDEDTATDDDQDTQSVTRSHEASTSAGSGGGEAIEPARLMSEKARGKQPAHRPQVSRQTSLSRTTSNNTSTASLPALLSASQTSSPHHFIPTQAWLETWLPYLPLHTIIEVCDTHQDRLKAPGFDTPSSVASSFTPRSVTTTAQPSANEEASSALLARRPISMSWYLSLIWGLIFAADTAINKGIRGVWTGTAIKLFNIESREQAITLRSPKGAVDALGDSIAHRLSTLSFTSRDSQPPVAMREV